MQTELILCLHFTKSRKSDNIYEFSKTIVNIYRLACFKSLYTKLIDDLNSNASFLILCLLDMCFDDTRVLFLTLVNAKRLSKPESERSVEPEGVTGGGRQRLRGREGELQSEGEEGIGGSRRK